MGTVEPGGQRRGRVQQPAYRQAQPAGDQTGTVSQHDATRCGGRLAGVLGQHHHGRAQTGKEHGLAEGERCQPGHRHGQDTAERCLKR